MLSYKSLVILDEIKTEQSSQIEDNANYIQELI